MAAPKVIQNTPETAMLTARIEDMRHAITMIGKESRFAAGLWVGFVKGLAIGIIVSLLLAGLAVV